MSILAYVGIPGSGKSYEVVGSVILPAFLKGRRIVTNIAGINQQAFIDYCDSDKKIDKSKVGTIIVVTNEDVLKENFFPAEGVPDTICNAGDLICLDEIHRFWSKDRDLNKYVQNFFAEHRHLVNEQTKDTTDAVLISQTIKSYAPFIRGRIETTFRMQKHKALGLNNRYRVDIHTGDRIAKDTKIDSHQKKYNKKIFALYSSHTVSNAVENNVDKRVNIFRKSSLWLTLFGSLSMIALAVYFVWSFLHPNKSPEPVSEPVAINQPLQSKSDIQPVKVEPVYKLSSMWRITGELNNKQGKFVIIASKDGVIRLLDRELFFGKDLTMYGIVDNEKITYYSGV